jgi:hypothetical protein
MNRKVFISYGKEDVGSAKRLYHDLKASGFDPWLDTESLIGGQNWSSAISSAIRDARFFIALLSTTSVNRKGFVNHEISEALDVLKEYPESDIYLIPVQLCDCEPNHESLKKLQWIKLFPEWDEGLRDILKALGYLKDKMTAEAQAGRQTAHDSSRVKPDYDLYLESLRSALAEDVRSYVSLFAIEKTRSPGGDFLDLLRITANTIGAHELGRGSDEGALDELVLAAVSRGSNVVIVGEPGTGKSYGLRYIAAHLADECAESQVVSVPIIVPLRGLRLGSDPSHAIRLRVLQAASERPLVSPYLLDGFSQLHRALSHGVHIILFDGINEVYHGDEATLLAATRRAAKALGEFTSAYPDTRFVFTSRSIVQDGLLELRASAAFHLQRLSPNRAIDYLRKCWAHLQPDSTEILFSYLMAAGDGNLRLFLENPLALSLLGSVVAETGVLPRNEYTLYSQYVLHRVRRDIERGLLGRDSANKCPASANLEDVYSKLVKRLSCVATVMQGIGVSGLADTIQQSLSDLDIGGETPE